MLLLDKEELLEDIQKGNSLSKSFLACVDSVLVRGHFGRD